VKEDFTILIADRHRHVREFLLRELTADGYKVRIAGSGEDTLKAVYDQKPLHLVILDPDFADRPDILEKIQHRIPVIPVVVHTICPERLEGSWLSDAVTIVEKNGNSIVNLKELVCRLFGGST
jgi:response regulator RpfG family c-di-GMP phosphodiesterase